MEDEEGKDSKFDVCLYAGVAAGLLIGLLFAPQSGDETRAMLREKALQVSARAAEVAEKLK
jgi:gas vesicle protein